MLDPLQTFPGVMERFARVSRLRDGAYRHFCCPVHDDHRPSAFAWVHPHSRMLVLKCYRGCTQKHIMSAVGLTRKDIYLATSAKLKWKSEGCYVYQNADGSVAMRVLRLHGYDEDGERVTKKFVQQRPAGPKEWLDGMDGVQKPLYRLTELIRDLESAIVPLVFLVEGERKCDAVRSLGLTATTLAGGNNARLEERHLACLSSQQLVLCLDNDEHGLAWASAALFACTTGKRRPEAISIMRFAELPRGGDVEDWIEQRRSEIADEDIRHELLLRVVGLPIVRVE